MLTITLKIMNESFTKDLQLNEHQKIIESLYILQENQQLPSSFNLQTVRVKSERKKEYLNVLLNFEQADIYNGDIITIFNSK